MQAWGALLLQARTSPGPDAEGAAPEVVAAAAHVFQAYLQAGLRAAAAAAFDEDDGQVWPARLVISSKKTALDMLISPSALSVLRTSRSISDYG
jgi:hypothetical protein